MTDTVKINKYVDPNMPRGSRVMSIFTNCPQPAEIMLSKPSSMKKGYYPCQWLDNDDMHFYAIWNQNMPFGSRVMSICTNWLQTGGGQTHIVVMVQTQGSCNLNLHTCGCIILN